MWVNLTYKYNLSKIDTKISTGDKRSGLRLYTYRKERKEGAKSARKFFIIRFYLKPVLNH